MRAGMGGGSEFQEASAGEGLPGQGVCFNKLRLHSQPHSRGRQASVLSARSLLSGTHLDFPPTVLRASSPSCCRGQRLHCHHCALYPFPQAALSARYPGHMLVLCVL